jgi:hypothetical protein
MRCTPTPSPSIVLTFGFAIESIKEFGGVSLEMGMIIEIITSIEEEITTKLGTKTEAKA